MAAMLDSQAVAVVAGNERERIETGVQACAAFRSDQAGDYAC